MDDIVMCRWADSMLGKPYDLQATSCVVLALEAIGMQLGKDLVAIARPHLATPAAAIRWAKANGPGGFVRALIEHGAVEIQKGYERAWDVAIGPGSEWPIAAAVRLPGGKYMTCGLDGVGLYKPDGEMRHVGVRWN